MPHRSLAVGLTVPTTGHPSAGRWFDRRPVLALLTVLALALAIDGVRIWQEPPTATSGETAHTWPIALHLAHGRGYTACFPSYFPLCRSGDAQTAQREPLPVLVFAGLALLTGDSLLAAAIFNVGVRLAALLAIYWLTGMVAGRRAALLAAALWAAYLPAIKLVDSISGDLFAAPWAALALGMLVRAQRRGRWRDWAAAGVCAGLGALSRSALLVLAPVCAAGALHWAWRAWAAGERAPLRLLRPAALVVLAAGLTIAPWAVRNAVAFGRPIVGSTLVGYNLFRENYQLHSRNYLHYVDEPEATRAVARLMARQRTLRGTENEAQVDWLYTRAALHVIEDNPRRYLWLTAYRGLMLWFDVGVDPTDRTGTAGMGLAVVAEQAALLVMAGLGLWARWRQMWPLALSIAAICALYMAVIGMVRFLVPVMPLTIALSAAGACWTAARLGWMPAGDAP